MITTKTIAQSFSLAAHTYDGAAFMHREIAERLMERFDYIKINPESILDLGSGTGYLAHCCAKRFEQAFIVAADIALPMLGHNTMPNKVCADGFSLPFTDNSQDLVVSNLMLQWYPDPKALFLEVARVLKPNGLWMFTSFGPDSLVELRHSWQMVDAHARVNTFADMHDVGDALLQARFDDPVMDVSRLTVDYASPKQLMRDLKRLGAQNSLPTRNRGLTTPRKLQAMLKAYSAFQDDNGYYPASYEIVFGHAFAPSKPQTLDNGEVYISLESLKQPR